MTVTMTNLIPVAERLLRVLQYPKKSPVAYRGDMQGWWM